MDKESLGRLKARSEGFKSRNSVSPSCKESGESRVVDVQAQCELEFQYIMTTAGKNRQ